MAFQIMKDSAFLEELQDRYYEYATVESTRKTGLKSLFGPKPGAVQVLIPEGPAYPVFRVVIPEWKNGQGNEWEMLQRCYRTVLQMAADRHCEAIAIPLLEADNPDFPANIDYKVAVDTIREFLENRKLDVYLMMFRQNSASGLRLRMDVERFLSRNYTEWKLRWSSRPFADNEDRFDTITCNPPSEPCAEKNVPGESDEELEQAIRDFVAAQEKITAESFGQMPAPQASSWGDGAKIEDYCSCSQEPFDEREDFSGAIPAAAPERAVRRQEAFGEEVPKKAAAPKGSPRMALPRKSKSVDQSTGSLPDLEWYLRDMDAGFSETLLKLIDRSGKKDSEIYNKANVSRQHFSKIRNNPAYKPTKSTAIAFAIALELNMDETEDLIGRAGYKLTRSSKFDVIIMYFIQNRNYNMFDINETLYEFDQSLLGA
mgnify:CR=1 FL=1